MEIPEWNDVRVSVIRRLQSIAEEVPPGTETFEIADHAIDLALSTARAQATPAPLLFRNVWRNARYIVRRRRATALVLDPLSEDSPIGRKIADGALIPPSAPHTLEDHAVAADLEARIRWEAARLDRCGAQCFDGLLAGESLDETARLLNITPRRVKRIRARIRAAAWRIAYVPRAA